MPDQPRFLPASSFALDTFADIFTRSFEAYVYAGPITPEDLSRRVRVDSLDLYHSLVMLLGDEPAGMAVLGLRGDRAWCGGFGVMLPFRGRGLSHRLAATLLDEARQTEARSFSLEVLTSNEPAIRTYLNAGLRTRRDLLVLEWRRSEDVRAPAPDSTMVLEAPSRLLEHFAALHPLPAAWQRDLPALLIRGDARGLAILEDHEPAAYVLFQTRATGTTHILDVGARQVAHVATLLHALQSQSMRIFSVNEPADSPFISAFQSAGFVETDRQHEMTIALE